MTGGPSIQRHNDDIHDVQSTVLRTTLQQVSANPSASASDNADDASAAKPPECCVICLGDIAESCEAQPCSHANFDYLCLLTWLEQRESCPLCKTTVESIRYGFSPDRKQWKTYSPPRPRPKPTPTASDGSRSSVPNAASIYDHLDQRSRHHPLRRGFDHRGRRDANRNGAARPRNTGGDPLAHRRHVYRNQLYSLHVGINRHSRYRELTPQLFAADPNMASRARAFLRRELQVFEFLAPARDEGPGGNASATGGSADPVVRRRANNAEFLLEYVVAILKTVDVQGSAGQAEELIKDFVGRENARLLLHEVRAFLRSPYESLEAFDRHVQYPRANTKGRPGRRASTSRSRSRERGETSSASRLRSRSPMDGREVTYPSRWTREEGF